MFNTVLINFSIAIELICAIGMGVAGLFSAIDQPDAPWGFKSYAMTGVSILYIHIQTINW
jgi:hypothetical protein